MKTPFLSTDRRDPTPKSRWRRALSAATCRTGPLSPCRVMPLLFLAVAALLAFGGCAADRGALKNVSVNDLHAADQTQAFVLDVREPYEFADGHVPGATLIPLGQLPGRLEEVPEDRPVFVICRSGNRSAQAADVLVNAGRRDVRNVEGGVLAWVNAGYPLER